ncbi:hypothetical protein TWF225_004877 [Orbilia oligospora]|uniref:Uncharacterized protein n=1 Tax=Orbilia oligospora TaxID=2813651 RepID=A0A7C8JXT3_ORBOL|nr:hypothetical protein TWF751_005362 [Orbilia oligospora]KAF3158825.1 hypothetical protein TWF225_004877 [Orbilia oligospora]KAF3233215.1 hypothetical protein TWF128_003236 [Orbilia oligospora]KAF3235893.1 hypothetical protein TWF217_002829 [Orbilia oligospora]KAF3274789.1 hypothetical protein TWF132_003257 [Orbilia oligospora]
MDGCVHTYMHTYSTGIEVGKNTSLLLFLVLTSSSLSSSLGIPGRWKEEKKGREAKEREGRKRKGRERKQTWGNFMVRFQPGIGPCDGGPAAVSFARACAVTLDVNNFISYFYDRREEEEGQT